MNTESHVYIYIQFYYITYAVIFVLLQLLLLLLLLLLKIIQLFVVYPDPGNPIPRWCGQFWAKYKALFPIKIFIKLHYSSY